MYDIITPIANDAGDNHHMDDGHMMNGWWDFPLIGSWFFIIWLIFVAIGALVYLDAQKRGMNGLLWFILVILPWIGILFLIMYLIIRESKEMDSQSEPSARTILEQRYAKGDITRDEFFKIKNDIINANEDYGQQKLNKI